MCSVAGRVKIPLNCETFFPFRFIYLSILPTLSLARSLLLVFDDDERSNKSFQHSFETENESHQSFCLSVESPRQMRWANIAMRNKTFPMFTFLSFFQQFLTFSIFIVSTGPVCDDSSKLLSLRRRLYTSRNPFSYPPKTSRSSLGRPSFGLVRRKRLVFIGRREIYEWERVKRK